MEKKLVETIHVFVVQVKNLNIVVGLFKKITKLLDLLQQDLQLINKNPDIQTDHKLLEVKDRLESIINEKNLKNFFKNNFIIYFSVFYQLYLIIK